ncbi:hypothetical protein CYMTET_49781 [Cymbomonas tetramitiformis]|uniref:Uncharacterized protein n=1 Tax=Cymbomonas tetramitiformis TaxID=36881 RepID=A0AAE0BPF1_9CHLO|nr:hypothetical protein CYMTET_49781 [Cymbomonas tetramitiformis]
MEGIEILDEQLATFLPAVPQEEATQGKEDPASNTAAPNPQTAAKAKAPSTANQNKEFIKTTRERLLFLRQVDLFAPWDVGHGKMSKAWEEVASTTSGLVVFQDRGISMHGDYCRVKFYKLIEKWDADDLADDKETGGSSDFDELEELLTQLSAKCQAQKGTKDTKKKAVKHKGAR